ncbi:MAG: hypothetical protein IPP40_10535 [bacterium]|nr:hypothetical protein [bacterium]
MNTLAWMISLLISVSIARGADWHLLRDRNSFCVSDRGLVYVDVESFSVLEDGIVKAWIKYEPPADMRAEARSALIAARRQRRESITGFDNWGYDLELIKWDCVTERSCVLETSCRDIQGGELENYRYFDEEWEMALPGSMSSCIIKSICEVGGMVSMGPKILNSRRQVSFPTCPPIPSALSSTFPKDPPSKSRMRPPNERLQIADIYVRADGNPPAPSSTKYQSASSS